MLEIEDVGGGPAVVLLHGSPSSTADFAPVVAALAGDHRVLVPRLPGYGASSPLAPYTFAGVHELIETALLERGIREAAIVGFSQGAHHALALAGSTRIAVTRVVALAGYAALTAADRDGMRGFAAMLAAPDASLMSADFRAIAYQRFLSPRFATDPAATAQLDRWLAATTPAVLVDELRAVADSDVRPVLARARMPIVARVGALDAACPPSYSEEIARLCPHARLELVADCGHAQLIEQPEATVAAILAGVR